MRSFTSQRDRDMERDIQQQREQKEQLQQQLEKEEAEQQENKNKTTTTTTETTTETNNADDSDWSRADHVTIMWPYPMVQYCETTWRLIYDELVNDGTFKYGVKGAPWNLWLRWWRNYWLLCDVNTMQGRDVNAVQCRDVAAWMRDVNTRLLAQSSCNGSNVCLKLAHWGSIHCLASRDKAIKSIDTLRMITFGTQSVFVPSLQIITVFTTAYKMMYTFLLKWCIHSYSSVNEILRLTGSERRTSVPIALFLIIIHKMNILWIELLNCNREISIDKLSIILDLDMDARYLELKQGLVPSCIIISYEVLNFDTDAGCLELK